MLFRGKPQIRYFFRSSSQKTENSTIAFTETMAAKSIMEVDNPSENSRRNNSSSRSNRSFHNNSKQTAEKCKQEDEEKSIKYEDSHNFRGKQSFGDRSPKVSSNSKQTSIASRSTVSQSFQNIAFSWIFLNLPFLRGFSFSENDLFLYFTNFFEKYMNKYSTPYSLIFKVAIRMKIS